MLIRRDIETRTCSPEQDHMPGGRFYTEGSNGGGEIVASYVEGDVIDVQFTITAHHRGMIVMRLCDEARVTEECLEKYPPLERFRFEDDELIKAQPINPDHPYIFYLNPICVFGEGGIGYGQNPPNAPGGDSYSGYPQMNAKFKLPDGVACENCVLQMHWITANSCTPPTYRDFTFPEEYATCSGDGGAGWYSTSFADCEGGTAAEEFWNCADISIAPSDGSPPPEACPPWGPWSECGPCESGDSFATSRSSVGSASRSSSIGVVSRDGVSAAASRTGSGQVVSRGQALSREANFVPSTARTTVATGFSTRTRSVPADSNCLSSETRVCECPVAPSSPPPPPPPPPPVVFVSPPPPSGGSDPISSPPPPPPPPSSVAPGSVTVAVSSVWGTGFVNTITAADPATIEGKQVSVTYEGSPQMDTTSVWNASQDSKTVNGNLVTFTFTVQYNGFGFVAANLDSSVTQLPVSVVDTATQVCLIGSCIGGGSDGGSDDGSDDGSDGGVVTPPGGPVDGLDLLSYTYTSSWGSGFVVQFTGVAGSAYDNYVKGKEVDFAFRMNSGNPSDFVIGDIWNAEVVSSRVNGDMAVYTIKPRRIRFGFRVERTGEQELVGVFSPVDDTCVLDTCAVASC